MLLRIAAPCAGSEGTVESERQPLTEVSWQELRHKVGLLANTLRAQGVQRGDRVVSYMPNIPETVIAFLATASLGAIWSSCSPDFGVKSVIDRFQQIEPKVLFAVDGYQYSGKPLDRRSLLTELQQRLPSLQHTVLVPYLDKGATTSGLSNVMLWQDALGLNDPNGRRYRESYFEVYPGVWRHGDWMKITRRGSAIIFGRSDATLNKQGIRIGSSDIYRVMEPLPEVLDSLVVGVEQPNGGYYMPLFVVLWEGV